ncbi:LysR family transcriptional regulator [Halopseudomonas pachastrellae]|uniref:LysR family transcriptional regulator n=1 Tax=Halopseudomonas pachastrellae TaxID=254161 RepID=A0A1S8DJY2_9GAMM|nr:LysR family transcriptional regulator ArgP [Halopseudomonas pachastrellae]ONM45723.1 LysR family transcriptional regulator [Halopseudomonas pachastrellae]SFM01505.1 LysR family transcriptional regulator, chromosome initiation inhibitor [Halopseudomonas pachastrellae]|tara:strand:+ start:389 stop:1276 length:888 start_codon:yes stop_codon:yes gene_type:complete
MVDYKLLMALAAVIEHAGFERAASNLGLSQSAVSQRIKLLEARLGTAVLVRSAPPQATAAGQRLLNHVQQVRLLERDLQADLPQMADAAGRTRLRVALNADSLATWWAAAVSAWCERERVLLDLQVEDQDVGLRRMRSGEVAACLCAAEQPVAGARSLLLGQMPYLAVASPAFVQRHFPQGVAAADVARIPAVVFGPDDRLQHRFVQQLGVTGEFDYHLCPSSEGFVRMLEAGVGWGMVPALQVTEELETGRLLQLLPGQTLEVPLYWHYWRSGGQLLAGLTDELVRVVPGLLAS